MPKFALAALVAGLLLSACGMGSRSQFQDALDQDDSEISDIIFLRDLMPAAESRQIFNFDVFLEENGMAIHGKGEDRYVYGHDLVRACGQDCSPYHGLGQLLSDFVERKDRN